LNLDKDIWNYLKWVDFANHCAPDMTEFALAFRRAKEPLCHQRAVIQAGVKQVGNAV
jgi:hypothetical protein